MQTLPVKPSESLQSTTVNKKVLMINGHSAIQSCSIDSSREGSLFSADNILLFVLEGTIELSYGKAEYQVSKSQMVFLKKDILVGYKTSTLQGKDGAFRFLLFSLSSEVIQEFVKLSELPGSSKEQALPVAVNTPDTRLIKYVDSLEFYFTEPEKVESSLVKIKLLELLFYVARYDNGTLEQLLDLRNHFRTNITATVEENIMNSLSLNQLAVLAGRSLSSFRRDFLAIYNMPPSQWIRQKRLDKARELLMSTTMTVTDVCYTTGFENVAHFSRLFKSHFSYCPSELRVNKSVA